MSRVVPAARRRIVIESISALQRLQRELVGPPQKDKTSEDYKRALETTIKDLRNSLDRIKE